MTGAAVTQITLSHFRSHKQARLTCAPGLVAFYGPNGAGKTNLLEAISLLSPGRGLRRAVINDLAKRPEGVGWKIVGQVRTDQTYEVETWAEPGQSRQTRIDGKTAPQVALGRIMRMLWLVPSMDRLWIEGADGRRRFLDRATLSFEPSHAEAVLSYEKAMRERNRLLKDMVRDPHWYVAVERQMGETGALIHRNRATTIARLNAAQEAAETVFPTALLQHDIGEGISDPATLGDALTENRPRDMAAGRTLLGPHRADLNATFTAKGMAARDCSTGEQKALLISLILANARALAADGPPVLLLDEVAAHLDVGRRRALYEELATLGAQTFMTGTGAELFGEIDGDAQHFEVTETDGVSSLSPKSKTGDLHK
ncbi:DNA replication/repair protein RecF [Yoonia sp. 2307UL14-13]|uniref:DNA replication/repair protein RecF n=1 Tax=Yoonia sp. 2307UL14-13 TaxID=3126506 RepID=UPI0030B35DC6